jgi:hypothetical protein
VQPGPVTFEMARQCVDSKLTEADDLDWKERLPDGRGPRVVAEFCKDVAAMANTRGGLIVYGVTDDAVFMGVDPADINEQQYAQWVRNLVQPYLSGMELYALSSDDGTESVFVVDVPASELSPHSVAFDHTRDTAKSERATVTPYRDGSHTDWMAEHQIARAYAERLTRASDWRAAFDELRDWTVESLAGRGGPDAAWLVIVGRPVRPVRRTAPRLDGAAAKAMVDAAQHNPVIDYPSRAWALRLAAQEGYTTVGLNSWVITNRVTRGTQMQRECYVEFHHDGGFVFVVNLSQLTLRPGIAAPEGYSILNPEVVERACVDLEALVLQVMRGGRIDSSMRVQATAVSPAEQPILCTSRVFDDWNIPEGSSAVHRLRPVTVEIPAGVTDEETRPAAAELAAGILNQFGQGCQLSRYNM